MKKLQCYMKLCNPCAWFPRIIIILQFFFKSNFSFLTFMSFFVLSCPFLSFYVLVLFCPFMSFFVLSCPRIFVLFVLFCPFCPFLSFLVLSCPVLFRNPCAARTKKEVTPPCSLIHTVEI